METIRRCSKAWVILHADCLLHVCDIQKQKQNKSESNKQTYADTPASRCILIRGTHTRAPTGKIAKRLNMYAHARAHTHARTHARTHTHTHTHTHPHAHTHTHTHTHTHWHTNIHTHTLTLTHTLAHTCTHYTHTDTHTHTHTHAHTRTQACTHALSHAGMHTIGAKVRKGEFRGLLMWRKKMTEKIWLFFKCFAECLGNADK